MPNANLFVRLRACFPRDLDSIAVETESGLHYSWRDIDRATAMIANLLSSLDLPSGSRVAVQVEKSVEGMLLYLATLRAGYIFIPLNTAYQSSEIEYFIRDAGPAVIVCSPENYDWIASIARKADNPLIFTLGTDRTGTLLSESTKQNDRYQSPESKPDDIAAILYTSGTTGRSKGAMLTHENMYSNAKVLQRYWHWKKGDVLIHALPIFHVHGLFVAIHGALINGSKMIWFGKFDPKKVIESLPRATIFMGVPTLYVRMLAEASLTRAACRKMRLFISGSAPLLIETFNQWKERTAHTILERYGMSETVMLTSNPYTADPRFKDQNERRGGTVGFPLPGVDVRVCDDQDNPLGIDAIGGIQVRGPNVFKGYWNMPEKTAQEFTADGFFRTGDVGKIDPRGYITIVGRSKDLIISGGYNVYPAEIEGVINEMNGVVESAVVGVPHADFGEVGVAVIIVEKNTSPTGEQIIAALKSKLANFKIPKKCFIVDELPRNTMGKVQKNILRERYKDVFST